jgi:curved DNA-binding protein CbpA
VRRTHLRTLGITPAEDSLPEIKKAYRALARRLHPDKNHAADATELMKVANAAYEFLTKEGTD